MERATVSYAIETLDELLEGLISAYWDASEIALKDVIFDFYTTVNGERNELAKLSIDDINMRYEPVTARFLTCFAKYAHIKEHVGDWFPRTQTADKLSTALENAAVFITKN